MRFIPATMCRRNRCCAVRPQPALQPQSHCLKWQQPPAQQQQRQQPRQQGRRRPKQQHLIIVSDNYQQGARHSLVCAASSADGSSSSSPQEPQQQPPKPQGGLAAWFDRLPPQVQLGAIGAVAFVGLFLVPFLQPTFLYGDSSSSSGGAGSQHAIVDAREGSNTEEFKVYKLPRYIPGASELYDFLQENAMPRKTPDGRTESPGVLRIYLSSMIILALFYACSAVLSLLLRVAAAALRAVGLIGPEPPRKPDGESP